MKQPKRVNRFQLTLKKKNHAVRLRQLFDSYDMDPSAFFTLMTKAVFILHEHGISLYRVIDQVQDIVDCLLKGGKDEDEKTD